MKIKSSNTFMDSELDKLGHIEAVEPSPYLYTRILARIERRREEVLPKKWVWLTAVSLLAVLLLNVTALNRAKQGKEPNLVEQFHLENANAFHYE